MGVTIGTGSTPLVRKLAITSSSVRGSISTPHCLPSAAASFFLSAEPARAAMTDPVDADAILHSISSSTAHTKAQDVAKSRDNLTLQAGASLNDANSNPAIVSGTT